MRHARYRAPALLLLMLLHAGRASAWSASACGLEPAPPAVESGSVARYNASIDRVAAYQDAARAYSTCVSRAALAEQTAISNEARQRMAAVNAVAASVQKRIASNFVAMSAQLRMAGQKLAGAPRPGNRR